MINEAIKSLEDTEIEELRAMEIDELKEAIFSEKFDLSRLGPNYQNLIKGICETFILSFKIGYLSLKLALKSDVGAKLGDDTIWNRICFFEVKLLDNVFSRNRSDENIDENRSFRVPGEPEGSRAYTIEEMAQEY